MKPYIHRTIYILQSIPLYAAILAFLCGLLVSCSYSVDERFLVVSFLACVVLLVVSERLKIFGSEVLILPIFLLLSMFLFQLAETKTVSQDHAVHRIGQCPKRICTLVGTVAEDVRDYGTYSAYVIEIVSLEGVAASGTVYLSDRDRPSIAKGERIATTARIAAVKADRGFSRWLLGRDILLKGSVVKPGTTKVFVPRTEDFIEHTSRAIEERYFASFDPLSAAVLSGVILGKGYRIPKTVWRWFQVSGLGHIIVISGMNLAMILAFFYALVSFVLKRIDWMVRTGRLREIGLMIAFIPVVIYCALSGFGPSTLRSFVMITVGLVALLVARRSPPLALIALAFFCLAVASPALVKTISFQLSALATIGVIVAIPFMRGTKGGDADDLDTGRRSVRTVLHFVANTLIATLSVSIWTLPVILGTFKTVYFAGFVANIVMIPYFEIVYLPVAFVGTILLFVPYLSTVVVPVLSLLSDLFVRIAYWSSSLEAMTFRTSFDFSFSLSVAYYILLVFMHIVLRRKEIVRLVPVVHDRE